VNLSSTLDALIVAALKSDAVATSAGKSNPDWSNLRVFSWIGGYIGGKNRGRLPFIEYGRNTSDYLRQQVGATEGTQGGTVTTNWSFIVHVGKTSRKAEDTNEDLAYKIAETAMSKIRTNEINCRVGNEQFSELTTSSFSFAVRVDFTIENTWSEDLRVAP
jgi:hypothetical protein